MNVLRPQTVFFFRAQVSGRRPLVCFLVWCHRREHRCSGPRSLTAALKIRERRLARALRNVLFSSPDTDIQQGNLSVWPDQNLLA